MNDKYSNYAILRDYDPFKLEIQVIEYMEEGWEPIGGIGTLSNNVFPVMLYQAMVMNNGCRI